MERNSLDRIPTKNEKIFGIIASAISVIFFGFLCFVDWYYIIREQQKSLLVYVIAIFITLLLWLSLFLLYRSMFTKRKKPGRLTLIIASYTLIVFGLMSVLYASVPGLSPSEKFYFISAGSISLSFGVKNFKKSKKHDM